MTNNNIRIRILIAVLLLFIFLLSAEANSNLEEKRIITVFRLDDYSSRSSTDIEVKLIEAFQKYNVSCTFGVIPYAYIENRHNVHSQNVESLPPVKVDILKNAIKAGVLEVALHGYSHQTIRKKADGGYTEFYGLDYNSQVKRIAKGKNYLEEILDIQVATFIPPWDSYDLNTIRALEKLKIKTISANIEGSAKESSQLKFLPAICHITWLQDAVELARRLPDAQPVIVVLLHHFDFLEVNRKRGKLTYQDFVELLSWITSQKDIRVRSIDQATKVINDLSACRFIKNRSYFKQFYSIEPPFSPFLNKGVYLSQNTVYNMKSKRWAFILSFYLVTLAISITVALLGGIIVFSRSRFVASICKYGTITLLVLTSLYALRDLKLFYKGAMAIVVLLGVCIGIWGSFLKLKKQSRLK